MDDNKTYTGEETLIEAEPWYHCSVCRFVRLEEKRGWEWRGVGGGEEGRGKITLT